MGELKLNGRTGVRHWTTVLDSHVDVNVSQTFCNIKTNTPYFPQRGSLVFQLSLMQHWWRPPTKLNWYRPWRPAR